MKFLLWFGRFHDLVCGDKLFLDQNGPRNMCKILFCSRFFSYMYERPGSAIEREYKMGAESDLKVPKKCSY